MILIGCVCKLVQREAEWTAYILINPICSITDSVDVDIFVVVCKTGHPDMNNTCIINFCAVIHVNCVGWTVIVDDLSWRIELSLK